MNYEIKVGDSLEVLKTMDDESVHCCVTSPPYWALRRYIVDGVVMKHDAPDWVKKEIEELGILPIHHTL